MSERAESGTLDELVNDPAFVYDLDIDSTSDKFYGGDYIISTKIHHNLDQAQTVCTRRESHTERLQLVNEDYKICSCVPDCDWLDLTTRDFFFLSFYVFKFAHVRVFYSNESIDFHFRFINALGPLSLTWFNFNPIMDK